MKQDIRLENMRVLLGLSGGNVSEFAKKLGINRTTVTQNLNGITPILDKHTKKIEDAFSKPWGWLDKYHSADEIKPLYDINILERVLRFIDDNEDLQTDYNKLSVAGKTGILDRFYRLFNDPEIAALSNKSLGKLLGIANEEIKKPSNSQDNGT